MHVAITGASAGIGEALARAWMGQDVRLSLVARRRAPMELLKAEAEARGGEARVYEADMGIPEQSTAWVKDAEEALGPIDVLVLNAGIQHVGPALSFSDEEAETQLRVNVIAPVRLSRRVAPAMVARGRGTIVIVSSVAGLTHTPMMADYSATKAYVSAYFETLRVELEGTGVHVLAVYPGPVSTAMEQAARSRLAGGMLERHLPTGTPEVLAKKVREAVSKGLPRLIYPGVYGVSRLARTTSQWFTWKFGPRPRD